MAIKLMYITNNPEVAKIAEESGVDRIFIDLETVGKQERQGGMDTVQSKHSLDDIKIIKNSIKKAELLVRSNPVYEGTKEEIDKIVENGADIIMLPYFKTVEEVRKFIACVGGRAKTMLLFETPEAVDLIDEIINIDGIDEVFIGLNDLSLGYGMKFMFELLADGTVEKICNKFKSKGLTYGFGGIAAIGKGTLPAENILIEHYRLGSSAVILSRSFCNTDIITDKNEIEQIFNVGLKDMRDYEKKIEMDDSDFSSNIEIVKEKVELILSLLGGK